MEFGNKKNKNFSEMSPEEIFKYNETWNNFQQVAAVTVAEVFERVYGVPVNEVDFETNFSELTNYNEEGAAHFVLDVHEELRIDVNDAELHPYAIYNNLLDFVLVLSAEMTDEKLGYFSMLDELEMDFDE